jgi:neutral trehalase
MINRDMGIASGRRRRWLEGIEAPPGLNSSARSTLAKALSIMKTQVYTPEGRIRHRWTTPDRWPHRGMWLWDSVFHAAGWRHLAPELAREMISAVLDVQQQGGFVPHASTPEDSSGITQPPVLALGASLVHEVAPSPDWLEALYPKLAACVQWDMDNRDTDGSGLVEWDIEGDPHCRSGESGMDNSPRFDSATQLDAVDFNSFLALECELLSGFARSLGRQQDAERWQERHGELCRLIRERLWSPEAEFFVDRDVETGKQTGVLASSGFLALICGAADRRQAQALAAHLEDPQMFGTEVPVPSVAACNGEHYSKDMWRGPMWANLNWLIIMGLRRYGFGELAESLKQQTMQVIEKYRERYGVLYEFYDDRDEVPPPELLRKGKCAPEEGSLHHVIHDYGWTATLYVDMAFA